MTITPVILAGGFGKRLWPLSTPDLPKQFVLNDGHGRSLFQASIARVADRARFAAPLIVAHVSHRFLILEQLRAIGCVDAQIILEPEARSTAPAIALAGAHLAQSGADGVMLVLPADHRVDAPEQLIAAIETALSAAEAGHIVTFAIAPNAPATAYGYIRYGAPLGEGCLRHIDKFIEKPDSTTAASLLRAGGHGWNSGMFLMRVDVANEALRRHAPSIHRACHAAYAQCPTDGIFLRPNEAALASCPARAFDVAVMEHTKQGAVLEVAMGWHDLGTWQSLAAARPSDAQGNVVHGTANLANTEGCFIHAEDVQLSAIGLRDMLVVAKAGQVVVAPKSSAHALGDGFPSTQDMEAQAITHRPWGHFKSVDKGADYQVKKLTIHAGEKISLQSHQYRSEHWVVVKGVATVTRGTCCTTLEKNESTYIAAGERHCLENRGEEALIVIEVQTGSYLGEDDITRFDER